MSTPCKTSKSNRPLRRFPFPHRPRPFGSLRASDADQRFVRQIHLRGTVIWQSPGLFCHPGQLGHAVCGDPEDVLPSIPEALWTRSGSRAMERLAWSSPIPPCAWPRSSRTPIGIAPLKLTAAEVVKRSLNGRRVRI